MKKIKVFVTFLLMVIQVTVSMCNPMIFFAETETTTEEKADFSDEEYQKYAWLVFHCTDWNNSVNINFTLGNEGIAFVTDVDSYEDFVGAFENKLALTLESFDRAEANGERLGVNHKYKWVEYEKIISCMLWCMLVEDDVGNFGSFYTFEKENEEDVNAIQLVASFIVYMDDNQRDMMEAATNFYICSEYKDDLINKLGYTEENYSNMLWKELGKMYLGSNSINSFDDLVKELVRLITAEDGTVIPMSNKYASGDLIYSFDPYADKNSVYGCLNFILLDSCAMKFKQKGSGKTSFFKEMVNSGNFDEMLDEYMAFYTDDVIDFKSTYDWTIYYETAIDVINNRKEGDSYYIYSFDYGSRADGLGVLFDNNYRRFNYNTNNDVLTLPGARESASGDSFGSFWYKNYVSGKIVNHTINGITGEVIGN